MQKQNSLAGKSISPTSGKKGENEGKLFHKNSHLGNLCETSGGNERGFRFHDLFQLHSTVLTVPVILKQQDFGYLSLILNFFLSL